MKPGTHVVMSWRLKRINRRHKGWAHVQEFGNCVGIVQGPTQPGWPEVDVYWQPSNLRYSYLPKHLVVVACEGCWAES